jgi:prepilin-type N-terminal cleavage/methylation domain-containing protein
MAQLLRELITGDIYMLNKPLIRTVRDEIGFTIIEVIVVIAIIGIIAAIGIPGFSRWLPNYRLRLAAQELLSSYQLAKTTAIKRNTNCTVIFSIPSIGRYINIGGVNYEYVVFVDSDRDLEYDAGEQVIRSRKWADYKDEVSFNLDSGTQGTNFMANDNNLPAISFRSNGMPISNDGLPSGGTVYLTNINNRKMQINLGTAGSVTITTG